LTAHLSRWRRLVGELPHPLHLLLVRVPSWDVWCAKQTREEEEELDLSAGEAMAREVGEEADEEELLWSKGEFGKASNG
jgi:hypothetical protein